MKFYAIRHKETQEYMPEYKNMKGYSFWLADEIKDNHQHHPRLLKTREQAQKCIVEWAKGIFVRVNEQWVPNINRDPEWMWEIGPFEEGKLRIKPLGRNKDMLEVVELNLEEVI